MSSNNRSIICNSTPPLVASHKPVSYYTVVPIELRIQPQTVSECYIPISRHSDTRHKNVQGETHSVTNNTRTIQTCSETFVRFLLLMTLLSQALPFCRSKMSSVVASSTLRRLVDMASFGVLQEKLESWLDDFSVSLILMLNKNEKNNSKTDTSNCCNPCECQLLLGSGNVLWFYTGCNRNFC